MHRSVQSGGRVEKASEKLKKLRHVPTESGRKDQLGPTTAHKSARLTTILDIILYNSLCVYENLQIGIGDMYTR